jgi:hypothetical protein
VIQSRHADSPAAPRCGWALLAAYLDAKEFVIESGYAWEIDWQHDVAEMPPSESDFLREAAWVILCSGFRESVVRGLFPRFSTAFFHWESGDKIRQHRSRCCNRAMDVFGNCRKVNAVCDIAARVAAIGFEEVMHGLRADPVPFLQTFSYIGPTTAYHLAKNLGERLAKPDRHLERVTEAVGFTSTHSLCEAIAESVGDPVPVVDVVIWRFATLRPDYVDVFESARR